LKAHFLPAESFILIENSSSKIELVESFGGGYYSERCVSEIQGIADKILGKYGGNK
jgi:hypothetical protein